jgi:hypothetical protein
MHHSIIAIRSRLVFLPIISVGGGERRDGETRTKGYVIVVFTGYQWFFWQDSSAALRVIFGGHLRWGGRFLFVSVVGK